MAECRLLTEAALAALIAAGWELLSGPHATAEECATACAGLGCTTLGDPCPSCPDTCIPNTLVLSLTNVCEGMLDTVTLTFALTDPTFGDINGWIGSGGTAGGSDVTWIWACTAGGWQLQFVCGTDIADAVAALVAPASCDPFSASGTIGDEADMTCCAQAKGFTVTEE